MRPRALDLFCGAGGMSMGLHRAGFDVVGVDLAPQPNYPFRFVQMDALQALEDYLDEGDGSFDAFHASCPCQRWAGSSHWHGIDHPDLIAPTRELLKRTGKSYVIENVPGAPLENPVTLCGTMFGLGADGFDLRRHRNFECSFPVMVPGCQHTRPSLPVFGHGVNADFKRRHGRSIPIATRREAMGIDWMNRDELAEAIPPAYGQHVGEYLLAEVRARSLASASI